MSSALSRRIANRRAEAIQKLIIFCMGDARFAMPIQTVERVVPLEQLYGAPSGIGLRFAIYQDREILVIDAEQRIFGSHQTRSLLPAPRSGLGKLDAGKLDAGKLDAGKLDAGSPIASTALALLPPTPPAYLLILQTLSDPPIGITLNAPPTLRRVPLSAFKPLPPAYLAAGSIRCISALIAIRTHSEAEETERPQEPPLFLLNVDLLLQPRSR